MAEASIASMPLALPEARARAGTLATSWYARIIVVGAVSIVTGVLWDISWHRTVGRDSFWTSAHLAIYLGGVLGGCVGGWLAFRGTFLASTEERAGMVSVFGLRAPFGAWLCIWGALAMLTSAPFDDWWHNAYGLDVKILSPPHTVLALGMWSIVWGALFLVLREQNLAKQDAVHCAAGHLSGVAEAPRAGGTQHNSADPLSVKLSSGWQPEARALPGQWLVIVAGGILIAMAATFHTEHSWPNQQRSLTFYQMSSVVYPLYLTALARASNFRFGATLVAATYMLIYCVQGWLLPLFAGQPKLGPVYNPVNHFVPLTFPLLLVVPALAIDLLRWWRGARSGWWRDWLLAAAIAVAFTGLFFVTQWYFSAFLISEGSYNRFFFGDLHWGYSDSPGAHRKEFWHILNPQYNPPVTRPGMLWALLWSFCAVRVGLWFGQWLGKVRR